MMLRAIVLVGIAVFVFAGGANAGKTELGKGGSIVEGSGGAAGAQGASDQLVKCAQPIGVAALLEPKNDWYHTYYYRESGLGSPLPMIKVLMQQSGCFTIVDRGRASAALKAERELASDGEFQKGSNLGGGQMVAADYIITPDVVRQNKNSGGAFGGLGGLVPGVGGLLGGLKTKKLQSEVSLAVTNVRTSVQEAIATGSAQKKDLSFAGLGVIGGLIGGGGAYEKTDIGKVTIAAYMDAHNKLVTQLGAIPAGSANVDNAGYVTVVPVDFRSGPSSTSPVITRLEKGAPLLQTGNKKGDWWEVEAAGQTGWVHTDYITR